MAANLLLVMARASRAGAVKRRLCPNLSEEQARAVYVALLLDTRENLREIDETTVRFICPPGEGDLLCSTLGPDAIVEETDGDGFGRRLENAVATAFSEGYQRVLATHADIPDLPRSYIGVGLERLTDEPDYPLLQPTIDGGFALIGLARRRPEWFAGIPWGTPQVANRLRDCSAQLGFPAAELPEWQDVDTFRDLEDCLQRGNCTHLDALARAGMIPNGART